MLVRRLARPMLASVFISGGIDTLRNPGPRVEAARPVVDQITDAAAPLAEQVDAPPIPTEPEAYVKANAALQIGAGFLLATGKAPRLAATALGISLVPTTLAGHRFWELEGDQRKAQQIHFTKNVALLGGLVLAAVDTEGRPDLIHRVEQLGSESKVAAGAAKANAKVAAKAAQTNARAARRLAEANATAAAKAAGKLSRRNRRKAAKRAKHARREA